MKNNLSTKSIKRKVVTKYCLVINQTQGLKKHKLLTIE
jgi:hypothetical protein